MTATTPDNSSSRGVIRAVRELAVIHGRAKELTLRLTVAGTFAGFLEAAALVLFMSAALQVTGGEDAAFDAGPFSIDTSPSIVLVGAAACIVVAALLHALVARLISDGSLTIVRNARRQTLTAYLRAPWKVQAEVRDGLIQDSVFNQAQSASNAAVFALSALNGCVILVTLLIVAVVVSPGVTLVLGISLIPILGLLQPVARFARRRAHLAVGEVAQFSEEVAATGAMALEIHAFGVQEQQIELLDDLNDAAAEASRAARFSTRLASFWFKDLALLMLILIVAVINAVWDLSDPSATAALLVVVRALGYAQQTYNAFTQVTETVPTIGSLVDRTSELSSRESHRGTEPLPSLGQVRLDRISYTYPNGHPALDGVDLTLEPGTVTGIVGRSGAGKSTIAEILLRLREPSGGSFSVDGRPVASTRIDDWRRLVAYVPQEPRLWRRTIAENIEFHRKGFSRDDVVNAAILAHIDDEIQALPNGYDTVLGSQSRGLSGGQRQRLAIARALISDPSLIVLDEPTSALDHRSEALVQATLAELRGRVTTVIIAHRVSTLDICDDLVILEDGHVIAHGPRAELLANHPFFERYDEGDRIDFDAPSAT